MKKMDTLPPVMKFLSGYKGKRVFFEPLGGNNGDTLLKLSSIMALRENSMKFVPRPEKADVIVINGGAKKDDWLGILGKYSRTYPDIPLIILPSSWLFKADHEISRLFNGRRAPCYIYCREENSLSALKKIKFDECVNIGIDHDMAFHIEGTRYLNNLEDVKSDKFILVVERGDDDSVTNLQVPDTLTRRMMPKLVDLLPLRTRFSLSEFIFSLERMIFSRFRKKEVGQTRFTKDAVEFVKRKHANLVDMPVYSADISLQAICNFREFGTIVAKSAAVVTTRLHVAILAALLGKPTYLVEGRWFKQLGVYEYSMKNLKTVRLLTLNSLFKS